VQLNMDAGESGGRGAKTPAGAGGARAAAPAAAGGRCGGNPSL